MAASSLLQSKKPTAQRVTISFFLPSWRDAPRQQHGTVTADYYPWVPLACDVAPLHSSLDAPPAILSRGLKWLGRLL